LKKPYNNYCKAFLFVHIFNFPASSFYALLESALKYHLYYFRLVTMKPVLAAQKRFNFKRTVARSNAGSLPPIWLF